MTKELLNKILIKEVVGPILVIAFSILIYGVLRRIIKKMLTFHLNVADDGKNKTVAGLVCSIIKYLFVVIDILIILNIFGVDTAGIIASLGVVGVVAGLAIQDTLKDFVSGIFILSEDQYRVGDWIEINGFKGVVTFLGLKTTRIRAYTGEIKIISNRNITEVINYSKSNSMAIVDVPIEYKEDTEKIEALLLDLAQKLSKELPDLRGKVELLGIDEFADSSVKFRLVAPTKPMAHINVQRLMRKAIKDTLQKENIVIPFRQVVVHHE